MKTRVTIINCGTGACDAGVAIDNTLTGSGESAVQVNTVLFDSNLNTHERIPVHLRSRFLALPTDAAPLDVAARHSESFPWVHLIGPPSAYNVELQGLGGAHEPRNPAHRFVVDPEPVVRFVRDAVALARQRSLREAQDDPAMDVLVFTSTWGAVGQGLPIPLAQELRRLPEFSEVPFYLIITTPNERIASGAPLMEYDGKLEDLLQTAVASYEGKVHTHPSVPGFPFNLVLMIDTGLDPDVRSIADHESVVNRTVVSLVATLPHFQGNLIDCAKANLGRRMVRPTDRHKRFAKLVPIRNVTLRCETAWVATSIQYHLQSRLADALLAGSGSTGARPLSGLIAQELARARSEANSLAGRFVQDVSTHATGYNPRRVEDGPKPLETSSWKTKLRTFEGALAVPAEQFRRALLLNSTVVVSLADLDQAASSLATATAQTRARASPGRS